MIKKLSSYIGEYKKDSILTPVFVACEVVLEVIIPVLMAKIVDNGIQKWRYEICNYFRNYNVSYGFSIIDIWCFRR